MEILRRSNIDVDDLLRTIQNIGLVREPCDYFCYGPYVVLEPGTYDFWWEVSGPYVEAGLNPDTILAFVDIVNNIGTSVIKPKSKVTRKHIRDWWDGKFEGGIGLSNVEIPTTTANVECRLYITEHCEWMIAKRLIIVKNT